MAALGDSLNSEHRNTNTGQRRQETLRRRINFLSIRVGISMIDDFDPYSFIHCQLIGVALLAARSSASLTADCCYDTHPSNQQRVAIVSAHYYATK